jgi:TolA-binding protein
VSGRYTESDDRTISRPAATTSEEVTDMKVRHLVAAATIAIGGLVGTASLASATVPARHSRCAAASARVAEIQRKLTSVEQRIATLNARLTAAQGANQTDRVTSLQARISRFNQEHDRLAGASAKVTARCPS